MYNKSMASEPDLQANILSYHLTTLHAQFTVNYVNNQNDTVQNQYSKAFIVSCLHEYIAQHMWIFMV